MALNNAHARGTSIALTIDLEGRNILVCGVARGGIGGATARRIAAAGAHVIAVDHSRDIIDATVADVEQAGGKCDGIVTNLMDTEQSDRLIDEVLHRFDRIDGVANVAGGTRDIEWMPLEEVSTSMFRETLNLNLEYVFRVCRDAAAAMIKAEVPGALVNVTSISALTAAPLHGPYGAAKSGIAALTRTMAFEWGRYGIRANSVAPGAVITQRIIDRGGEAVEAAQLNSTHDMAWTTPDELADAIVFLLSDLASGISGQNLVVDSAMSTKFCGGVQTLKINKSMGQRRM